MKNDIVKVALGFVSFIVCSLLVAFLPFTEVYNVIGFTATCWTNIVLIAGIVWPIGFIAEWCGAQNR